MYTLTYYYFPIVLGKLVMGTLSDGVVDWFSLIVDEGVFAVGGRL